MRKSSLLAVGTFLAALLPFSAHAASLIKGSTPAVYEIEDGKRWVFPNERVYFSWHPDFSEVQSVTDQELAAYQIGGNVTYKPGLKLVKIQSDPRVFAVGKGGILRWLKTEEAAAALYGADWNKQVDDIPDSFFANYRQGESITAAADFDKEKELSVGSIADDLAARTGTTASHTDDSTAGTGRYAPSKDASTPAGTTTKLDFTAVKGGTWGDKTVWGGQTPTLGARVLIPPNVKIIYDVAEAPDLRSLDVQGTLEFYASVSTRLAAQQINVRGALTVGSNEAPLLANRHAEIVLTGSSSGDDGLTIDGGTLSLHGDESGQAWTTLAEPAEKDATSITTSQLVTWPVGGEVAVFGATAADAPDIRKIVAIDGSKIQLDRPLSAAHRSEDGLHSEVALATRNVVVSGVGGGAGSYVRAINHAKIDLSNVELYKLGRKGMEGQYPLLLDGLTGGSVKRSVIRSSGNRCLVLHQSSGVTIGDDVAFDAYGHCFATADGTETKNIFSGNLAAQIHAGVLTEDAVPAAFYLKNPDNTLTDNAAIGSDGFGFWYFLPENASKNDGSNLKPRETALGVFSGNLARGNKKTGLYLDDNGKGQLNYVPDQKAVFSGFSAVMNGERGFWIRGSNIEVSGATLAENPIGGTFAAFAAVLKDSTITGRLEGSASPGPARYGFTYVDGPVSVQNTSFSHFTEGAAALGFESNNPLIPDPRNSLQGASFTDAQAWHLAAPSTPGDAMSVVRDLDAGDVIGAKSDFLGPNCTPVAEADAYRCTDTYAQLQVALRDSPGDRNVTFTNLATKASVTLTPGPAFDGQYAYANVAEGGAYRVATPGVMSMRLEYDGLAKPLMVRIPASPGSTVKSIGQPLEKKELPELAPGTWAYDSASAEAVLWLNPGDAFDVGR